MEMGNPNAECIADLQTRLIAQISKSLRGHTQVALVDFPHHRNAGDSLIWLGERKALMDLLVDVRYVADMRTYRPSELEASLEPGAPILINGGGNFGDLWPTAQTFRERIVRNHPHRPIVQMPQTVYFADDRNRDDSRRIFSNHADVQFLVRDTPSIDRLDGFATVNDVCLVPDAAFALGDLWKRRDPEEQQDIRILAREDKEVFHSGLVDVPDIRVSDWRLSQSQSVVWNSRKWASYIARAALPVPLAASYRSQRTAKWTYDMQAQQLAHAAMSYLAPASKVVTDRLHAHILCVLMGKNHVVLDNEYGKVSEFYNCWTAAAPTVHWRDDVTAALFWLRAGSNDPDW